MAHENHFLRLVLNTDNGVDHTNILAHLECCFSVVKLQIFQALFANSFIELKRELEAALCHIDTVLELLEG